MKTTTTILAAIIALVLPRVTMAMSVKGNTETTPTSPAEKTSTSANDDSLVEVFATGVGMTQDEAHKAADKAAVEQVVGTIVDATTLVENDELVEDKILTYSAALIADSKIIGTPKKGANGLITLKVKATVKKTALKEKLTAAKLVSVAIDGESLWAQAVSAQDNLADAEAMIKDVLAKHTACIVAEPVPGKTGKSPLDYDPKTGEVFANVRVRIDSEKYRQFIREIVDKLGTMAVRKEKVLSKHEFGNNENWLHFLVQLGENGESPPHPLLILGDSRGMNGMVLFFEPNKAAAVAEAFDVGQPCVSVAILDSTGYEVACAVAPVAEREADDFCWENVALTSGSLHDMNDPLDVHVIAPLIGFSTQSDWDYSVEPERYDITLRWWGQTKGMPPSERIIRVPLGTFTADELKRFGKLVPRVGHMKDGQFAE